jgi:thiamine pyrophosphokinase
MSTVLVFAGGNPVPLPLRDELPEPDRVIAADSGHENAIALGFDVDVIVGDFDSLSPGSPVAGGTRRVRHPEDKDATDLELALELAVAEAPRRIVLVGAEGGRFDHELAALTVVGSPRWAGVPEIEWVRSDAHVYVIRKTIRIQGDPGAYVSLLAVGGDAVGITTTGLVWALKGETLRSGSSRGASNQFGSPEATIRVEEGALVAVVPRLP